MSLPPIEPMLTLAHTLHTIPGSHALVIGAGVSTSSGVPSAWGVQVRLIQRLADCENTGLLLDNDTAHPWFEARYGQEVTYESLIEALGQQSLERQGLLREFFEGDAADPTTRPLPAVAHEAIAKLAALGAIRVIITLNFDRLIETALRAAGLKPVIVSSVGQIRSLPPLHTIQVLVVHLHGDYLEATTMRNTRTELEKYPKTVRSFLQRVFDDYGVVTAGWSATYDPALVASILASRPRFTTYIIDPAEHLSDEAESLRGRSNGIHVRLPADEAFATLAEAVTMLASRRTRHPLSVEAAVSMTKRHLTGQAVSVDVHDALHAELTQLRDIPELDPSQVPAQPYGVLVDRVQESTSVPAAMIAAAAYWGNDTTDQWWLPRLDSYAFPEPSPHISTDLQQLPLVAGTMLFHAAGLGALAAGRHDLVADLLLTRKVIGDHTERPTAAVFAPEQIQLPTPSAWLFDTLRPVFVDHLVLGERRYRDVWEMFEYLRLVGELWRHPSTSEMLAEITSRSNASATPLSLDAGTGLPSMQRDQAARQAREAELALQRARGELSRLLHLRTHLPHLRARDTPGSTPRWGAAIQRQAAREAGNTAWLTLLAQSHSRRSGTDALRLLVDGVSDAIGTAVHRDSRLLPLSGAGSMPTHIWVDTAEHLDS